MTQLLLPRPTTYLIHSGFGFDMSSVKTYKGSKGGKVYAGVPVFRTGTFRDSLGYQNTWESLHLEQMISNGNYLAKNNIAEGWPVRDGHSTYLVGNIQGRGNTVGWTQNLETKKLQSPVDNQEYDYLLADFELTEPYAQDKLDNGTWRNRSSEIGQYSTNSEVELWPVFMGFAYVDIPAVEGLNFSSSTGAADAGARFYVDLGGANFKRETPVTTDSQTQPGPAQPVLPLVPFSSPAVSASQPTAPASAAPAAPAQAFTFNCNGTRTNDPTVVQNYINALEGAAVESRQVARAEFVKGLITAKKVLQTQEADYVTFAMGLNDEQYKNWQTQMLGVPVQPLLGQHAVGAGQNTGAGAPGSPQEPVDQAIQTAKDIVAQHRRSGMAEDAVKKTSSYQKLIAAGVTV